MDNKYLDIFKDGNIVIPLFLYKNYKSLKLELDEFIFLVFIHNKGNKCLFDPELFASNLGLELMEIMTYVSNLTDKGFIKVETNKNDKGLMEEVINIDGFYNKISLLMMEKGNKKDTNDTNIYEIIEKEFGRTLSPMEYEIIKAWLEQNISEELIKEAIKEATFNGVSNLRYIDKILYEWGKAGIKNSRDVEENRKKRNSHKDNKDENVDIDLVDWNWFEDDE